MHSGHATNGRGDSLISIVEESDKSPERFIVGKNRERDPRRKRTTGAADRSIFLALSTLRVIRSRDRRRKYSDGLEFRLERANRSMNALFSRRGFLLPDYFFTRETDGNGRARAHIRHRVQLAALSTSHAGA